MGDELDHQGKYRRNRCLRAVRQQLSELKVGVSVYVLAVLNLLATRHQEIVCLSRPISLQPAHL